MYGDPSTRVSLLTSPSPDSLSRYFPAGHELSPQNGAVSLGNASGLEVLARTALELGTASSSSVLAQDKKAVQEMLEASSSLHMPLSHARSRSAKSPMPSSATLEPIMGHGKRSTSQRQRRSRFSNVQKSLSLSSYSVALPRFVRPL